VLRAHLTPDPATVARLAGRRVLAFAGIGDPARFFRTLRGSGIDVIAQRVFPDHHPFSKTEIDALTAEAARDGLTMVTTEKDLARLRDGEGVLGWAHGIVPFAVKLGFADTARLRKFVLDQLFEARQSRFQRGN
jgi:tetraacyldisaccharide 4'-kinase